MFRSFFGEFKKFAMRGNVIDMAVGIIIGASFGRIIDSLVKDILMPPLGLLLGNVDFTNLFIVLKSGTPDVDYVSLAAAQSAGAITMNVGLFLNTLISFLIVAFAIFILIKSINKIEQAIVKEEEATVPDKKNCPFCCSSIPIKAVKCPNCTSDLK